MDDEKLILLVKERSELYDKYNPLFKIFNKKQEAWMDIAIEMGMPAEDCMRRWTSLRDRFTRESRLMSTNSDASVDWYYFKMMEFLRPFISSRPLRVVRYPKPKMSSILQKHSPAPSLVRKSSPLPSPPPAASLSPAAPPIECGEYTQIVEDPLNETPYPCKRKLLSNPDVDKSFCDAVETLKKACALSEARHANPAVYAFGEMIVSTICSMNSRNQLKAMQQVTDVVMRIKLEEDELLEKL